MDDVSVSGPVPAVDSAVDSAVGAVDDTGDAVVVDVALVRLGLERLIAAGPEEVFAVLPFDPGKPGGKQATAARRAENFRWLEREFINPAIDAGAGAGAGAGDGADLPGLVVDLVGALFDHLNDPGAGLDDSKVVDPAAWQPVLTDWYDRADAVAGGDGEPASSVGCSRRTPGRSSGRGWKPCSAGRWRRTSSIGTVPVPCRDAGAVVAWS